MSGKKKFNIEYEIKSSPRILYSFLSEPNGLTQWFADDVSVRDQVFTFNWDGEEQKAKLLCIKENKLVRFKWLDDDLVFLFVLEILLDVLSYDVAFSISDFVAVDILSD